MHIYWMSCIFIFGLCMGSFMNVVVWRLPRGGSIIFPSSHCPLCGFKIRWFDNIPLISYLILLRCRCRRCKVFISPRYPVVEITTGLLMLSLYVCFFLLHMRPGFGDIDPKARHVFSQFQQYFPYVFSYCILVWALLSCSLTDIDTFTLPIGVCWFASIVGACAATFWPNDQLMPRVSHQLGAASCAAGIGLLISIALQHLGYLIPSFIDADYRPRNTEESGGNVIAATTFCGVNPRKEILKEVLFLTPAVVLAILAYHLAKPNTPTGDLWNGVYALGQHQVGVFLDGFVASLFGYLIGGLWIWGIRILGTLLFNKEAMGMGDVHLLAAVGAVCGWITPSLTFFVAPVCGLLYALLVLLRKHQKELPYGPWLSLAAYAVILFQQKILAFLMSEHMPLEFLAKK